MFKNACWLLSFIFLLVFLPAFAEEGSYYDSHAEGWHWYQDPKAEDSTDADTTNSDPIIQMDAVRKTVERALYKARLNPTKSNIKEYMVLQNKMMEESTQFSNVWKSVLLENPEMDFSLIHPTNNFALQIEYDEENKKEVAAIQKLAKQSGLFFFYKSTCPYCVKFAPILKEFSSKYGISVIPITTNGISLPEYPNSYVDQGQAAKFKVFAEPALFFVNPYTHKAYPVSFGLMSAMDLKKRILELTSHLEEIVQ